MNFTELLNNGLSLDDLNEPHPKYDFPLSQYHSGDDDENGSSKVRSELEEFRARRLESDRVKSEQLNLLTDIEQKQVALREKEIELQARSEETKIMSMDTSSMNPLQAEYIISLQRKFLAKRAGNGNE